MESISSAANYHDACEDDIIHDVSKVPPQNIDAEISVLGSILLDNDSINEICDILTASDFYKEAHRKIYSAILDLAKREMAIDYLTLCDCLKEQGELDDVGGPAYITSLTDSVPSSANIKYYARIVAEKATSRRIIFAAAEISRAGYEDLDKLKVYVDRAKQLIDESKRIEENRQGQVVFTMSDLSKMEIPENEMMLDPIFTMHSLNLIVGWRGIGKTHIAHGIAAAISSGSRFLKWKATRPFKGLLMDGEMNGRTIQKWLIESHRSTGSTPSDNLRIMASDFQDGMMPSIATIEGQDRIEPFLEGCEFLILDNLSTLGRAGNENDQESWAPIQDWLVQLRKRMTVFVFHHVGKSGDQRGTSSREDAMNTVIKLRFPHDYRQEEGCRMIIEFSKHRDAFGQDVEPFEIKLDTDTQGLPVWTCKDISSCNIIIDLFKEGMSAKEIIDETGKGKSMVYKIINEYKEQNKVMTK